MADYKNDGVVRIKLGCNYPSQLAPYSEKKTKEFGMSLFQAISSEWFYRPNGGSCLFYTHQLEFAARRLYAKGIQPMNKYFSQININGDKSYLNLPKKPISIIPKCVDIICNGFAERDSFIKATAIDPISQEDKIAYRKRLEDDKNAMPIIKKAQETLGVNVANFPLDQIPETDEEMELHMQIKYKPSLEISEELAIDCVMQENTFTESVEKRNRKDIAILGVAWAKHRFSEERGIMLEYVDPEYKIQSYSEYPDFRDTFYDGEFKTILISDVLIEYPWINEPQYSDLRAQLEFSGNNWYTYHGNQQNERIKGTTNLLYFTYKTTREREKKIKFTATGMKKVSDAIDGKEKKEVKNDGFKFVSKVEEIEFEGVAVLGTDILLKWEVSENMTRPKSNTQKVVKQYIGIAPNREKSYIDSLVARMMPIEDDLEVNRLKECQLIQRMNPDGYFFDIDGFTEIDLGDGALNPQGILDMLFQTGSTFGRSYTSGGDYNAGKVPIQELKANGNIEKIRELRTVRMEKLNEIRDVIGLNNASDASSPEKDSLVGLYKLAAANSNVATRDVLFGTNDIKLRIAIAVTYRIADVLQYSSLKEDLTRKIGAAGVMDLDYAKKRHLLDFAINLELALDDEQRAMLEADLSKEIDKGFIDTADKYAVLAIRNFKQAVQYLAIIKKKRQKENEEIKAREFEAQSQANIRASQAAEQFKQQTAQIEAQTKLQVQDSMNKGMIEKIQAEGIKEIASLNVEYDRKEGLQYIMNDGASSKQEQAEIAKDNRTRIQASQQSELIKQRQNDGAPKDFVAENAGLEQFDITG